MGVMRVARWASCVVSGDRWRIEGLSIRIGGSPETKCVCQPGVLCSAQITADKAFRDRKEQATAPETKQSKRARCGLWHCGLSGSLYCRSRRKQVRLIRSRRICRAHSSHSPFSRTRRVVARVHSTWAAVMFIARGRTGRR